MKEICVVYLVRAQNGVEPFMRFLESYRKNQGDIEHDFLVVFKGFERSGDEAPYFALLEPVQYLSFDIPDIGFDITAYFGTAEHYAEQYRYFCFLNSFSVILCCDWLSKLYSHITQPGVGLVGATGSWQSINPWGRIVQSRVVRLNSNTTLVVVQQLNQYAVEEDAVAGITDMVFITGRNKRVIEDHSTNPTNWKQQGKKYLLRVVRSIVYKHMNCIYIRQPEPPGLSHAVLCAQPIAQDSPFAAILSDKLIDVDPPIVKQMVEVVRSASMFHTRCAGRHALILNGMASSAAPIWRRASWENPNPRSHLPLWRKTLAEAVRNAY